MCQVAPVLWFAKPLTQWHAEARWCWECVRPCVSEHSWSSQLFWSRAQAGFASWYWVGAQAGPSFLSVICHHPSSPLRLKCSHSIVFLLLLLSAFLSWRTGGGGDNFRVILWYWWWWLAIPPGSPWALSCCVPHSAAPSEVVGPSCTGRELTFTVPPRVQVRKYWVQLLQGSWWDPRSYLHSLCFAFGSVAPDVACTLPQC